MTTEPLDDPTVFIVEAMAQPEDGVDLDPDAVRLLVSLARLAHRRCLSHWLRENEPAYMKPPSTGPYAKWDNRGKGNTGRFRDGSDLPRPPLAAIYFLVNAWWRRELGPFHPDFRALWLGDDYDGIERLDFINASARFFLLIALAVDEDYTEEQCKRVNDTHYRLLNRRRLP